MYDGLMVKDNSDLAVNWEHRPWRSDAAPGSRRERLRSRGPYVAAIPAEIAHLDITLDAEIQAEAAEAEAEIVRFDAEISHRLPGVDSEGEFAPLAAVLLRTESASSSQIENVTAGAKALALAAINERSGPNAVLVASNVAAMQTAIDLSDDLGVTTILHAHAALMSTQNGAQPGRVRDEQVWIGGHGSTPHSALFVPPHADRVRSALKDLMAFCDRTDIPPLTHASLAHAQFETIHPFVDGNGRTGRVLVHAMLRRSGLTRRLTVPVSAGLLVDTASYFNALTQYREGNPGPIVSRFSQASFTAVTNGRQLIDDLAETYETWQASVRARSDGAVWRVLPLLLRQPAITVRTVQEAVGVSQPAAQNAVDELVRVEAVLPASQNRRNRVWLAVDVIDALDRFAERAGRRTYGV